MKISIKDHKIIKEFNYSIDDIAVFTGDNGTGKTTNSDYLFTALNKNNLYLLNKLIGDFLSYKRRYGNNFLKYNKFLESRSKEKTGFVSLLESYFDNSKDFEYLLNELSGDIFEDDKFDSYEYFEILQELRNFHLEQREKIEDFSNNISISETIINKVVYITEDALSYRRMNFIDKNSPVGMLRKYVDYSVLNEDLLEGDIFQEIEKITNIKVKKDFNSRFIDENGNKFRWNDLSSGIKILTLLNEIIQNGHLNSKTLLILDEPENHLQPKWQIELAKIIVNLVKERKIKVLINTHSPFFVQAIEVYSNKNELKCNYYYTKKVIDKCICEDVTSNKVKICSELAEAFKTLADVGNNDK